MRANRLLLVVCFLLLFAFGTPAAQQPAAATISGRVTDPNGAVIVRARVSVSNKATGFQRETATNDEGLFVLTNLSPGEYEIKIQQPGFASATLRAVEIVVGQNARFDTTLQPGKISDDIDRDLGEAPLIDKETSVVDRVIARSEIDALPLNGRNFLELALLAPGNSPAPNFDPTKTNTVLISSAGQLGRGANVTVDGADNNDDVVGGSLINISQDAVQEFQIATNRFSAELGRSGSSVINIVTRSGGNDLHGSGGFFFRDRSLQALPATFDRSNPEPPFDREQYSATLGGPFVRNHVFWFGSFEYRNQDGAVLVGQRDAAARAITRSFAAAPLNDLLATFRGNWNTGGKNQLDFRYSIERAD